VREQHRRILECSPNLPTLRTAVVSSARAAATGAECDREELVSRTSKGKGSREGSLSWLPRSIPH
jgi:hypothetical protein